MREAKPFCIAKKEVWEAYKRVKENKGAAGVDDQSIEDFEKKLKKNLYKIWNRMSSGSYFPPPVRTVKIPKKNGGERKLGIPTVADRIAQQVVKARLELEVEPLFHADSYGYRPGKSALDAVGQARERCWRYDWVLDLDIKGFFDSLSQDLLLRAVKKHAKERWIVLYIERWLKAPVQEEDGRLVPREKGTPQGGVASPLLALHSEKTKIVYCKDDFRKKTYPNEKFDFLGYTFQPRRSKNRKGQFFINFSPAVSNKAAKAIRDTFRRWNLPNRSDKAIEDLSRMFNPIIRGWLQYSGRYYCSALYPTMRELNQDLVLWAKRKYKKLRRHHRRAARWIARISRRAPELFAHWQMGGRRGSTV